MAAAQVFKVSLSYKTPQAKDDYCTGQEDDVKYIDIAQLLANDLGGAAKSFYSLNQDDPRIVSSTATTKYGATITLGSDGTISYDPTAVAQIQALAEGEPLLDTFTYTIRLGDGTLSTATVTIMITGANDAAEIGTPTALEVMEDAEVSGTGKLTASGSISVSDADKGQAAFQTEVTGAADNRGSLTLAADGTYSYVVDNSRVQYLGAGESKVDIFTVKALDGTAKDISFTINGVNDAAI